MTTVQIISNTGVSTLTDTPANLYSKLKETLKEGQQWLYKGSEYISAEKIQLETFETEESFTVVDALIGG